MTIAEQEVASPFAVIVSGRTARGGKRVSARGTGIRPHLPIAHERLLRVPAVAAHVVSVADPVLLERLVRPQRRIFGAGTDKHRRIRHVAGDQRTERLLRRARAGLLREFAGVVIGIDVHRDVDPFQLTPAILLRLARAVVGGPYIPLLLSIFSILTS